MRVLSPFVSLCLPLSPIVPLLFPFVGLCVRLPEGLVSPSPIVPPLEGLVSLCLPLYPFLFPFVGWRVRLPEGLVSPCLPLHPFLFAFVGLCVRLPEGLPLLVSLCSLCWMVCPPSRGSCLLLSLIVPLLISLLLDGVSAFPGVLSPLVSHCLPVSPFLPACPHSCFPLLDGVSAFPTFLSPLVSHCLPSCFRLLDGVFAFPRFVLQLVSLCWTVCLPKVLPPCLPLSPYRCSFVGWCVRLPEALAPLSCSLSAILSPLAPSLSLIVFLLVSFVRPCLPLSPIVSLLVCRCSIVCPSSRGLVPLVSQLVSQLGSHLSCSLSPNLSPILSPSLPPSLSCSLSPSWFPN